MTGAAMRGVLPRVLLAVLLLAAPSWAGAEVPVPQLKARVTDLTSTLSGDQVTALERKLASLEAQKGSQVAVLLVPTTQPETVEQYATRVFDQWKLGRKGVDDGVLLLIAKNDRKLRIEVGRGLEGAIPDAYAKRIIDEEIAPRFKQGDFAGGIEAGVARIAKLIEGEPMPAPARRTSSNHPDYWNLIFYGFIAVMLVGGLLRSIFGRFLGSGIVGVAAGVVTYILVGAIVAAAIIAVIAFVLNLFNEGGSGHGSGWSSSGGSFSSGSSWSSGDSGGFSGGGGDSGGGGASGSW